MLASYNLQSTFSGFSFYDVKWTPWIIGGCRDHRMVSLRRWIKNCKSNIYISASYGGCIYSDLCDRYDHQPCISASCIFKDYRCDKADKVSDTTKKPVITLGSDNYPPYNYLNEDGVPTGIDVELATEAFEEWDIRWRLSRSTGRRKKNW